MSRLIRWSQPDDYQAVLAMAILNDHRHSYLGVEIDDPAERWKSPLQEAIKAGYVLTSSSSRSIEALRLVVAEEAGVVLGMLLLVLRGPEMGTYKAQIDNAYVLKNHRHKGICKEMLAFALEWSKDIGIISLTLSVASNNTEGRVAWKALGFEYTLEQNRPGFLRMHYPLLYKDL
jgi:ribosomal protein S18 acetylase RimI-like enzyme